MWEIDSDGDAYNDETGQFISCGKCGAVYAVFMTIGRKGLKVLKFAASESHARNLICKFADQFNLEAQHADQTFGHAVD